MRTIRADDLHKEWMRKPSYRRAYEALEAEYSRLKERLARHRRPGAGAGSKTVRPTRS